MKLLRQITPDKLRGGYYTHDAVVDWCIDRVIRLVRPDAALRWLEPSAGDGAFVRGIRRAQIRHAIRAKVAVEGTEIVPDEADKCEAARRFAGLSGKITNESFFNWADGRSPTFDALVGNPPYVRYQYVDEQDRTRAEKLTARLGIVLKGVSNLWIPFSLIGLSLVREGGAFALVLPSELFSTVSGGQFREMVVREFASLRVDLFPRSTFPDILQDVVVVSGIRARRHASQRSIVFCEHADQSIEWKHVVEASAESWLRYLLTRDEVSAFKEASRLEGFHSLGEVARIGVSIVTGANSFFTIDDQTLKVFCLAKWARPLLSRTSDCPGLVFTNDDHQAARAAGCRAWILDFSSDRPDPADFRRAAEYLEVGTRDGLADRFKCRIRTPWYRVPLIKSGQLMLTKRAHQYHRLILNEAGAFTTDTIYRGEMLAPVAARAADLVAGFQNTLTLLSSEIEGRTYGGGVLELIPSEVARLRVPLLHVGHLLPRLDAISRTADGQRDTTEKVLGVVDAALCEKLPSFRDLRPLLRDALRRLRNRRMDTIASTQSEA